MSLIRVLLSTVLLVILVTTTIDLVKRDASLGDAATVVLYSVAAFGALMLVLDYYEHRRR